jgi:hypothetical protein
MGVQFQPAISHGNYVNPAYNSDYEERMLFRHRDNLLEQIKDLESDESPYKGKAEEIGKNLKAVTLFVENQIYEKQVLRDQKAEVKKEESERLMYPNSANMLRERKNMILLSSMNGKLNEMKQCMSAAKSFGSNVMKYDMMRRAMEISTELKHQIPAVDSLL